MDENDLNLDEDLFLTKLALQILEGRSFDITGTKVPFDELFPKNEPPEQFPMEMDQGQDEEASSSSSSTEATSKAFISEMVQKIEMEYERLLKVEKQRVERFRLTNRDRDCSQQMLIERYQQTECHLTLHCKNVLEEIQEMQGKFKDPKSLKEVTIKLEDLWQHIEQDEQLKARFNVGLKESDSKSN